MIDFIPLRIYTDLFDWLVLLLVVVTVVECYSDSIFRRETRLSNSVVGAVVAALLILYIGLRPVSPYYFGDTINYALSFESVRAQGLEFDLFADGEWVFNGIMAWFAAHSNVNIFFLFCAFVYVGALWWAMVRIFGEDYFVPLVVAVSMFTFWSYGVNGVRNGMASSLVILAISFRRKLPIAALLAVLATGIHRSMLLTVAAAAVAAFVRKPRLFLWLWFGSIAVSLVAGNAVSGMMLGSGLVGDDRFASYLTGTTDDVFSREGFRWDFLLFSSIPVLVGSYFIFKRGYADKFYIWTFNIYLITNSFWVMVIRTNFSNRFAQISWFIMPLVLIYPFFMKKFWEDQPSKTGSAVIVFYLYTVYTAFLR